MSRLADGPKYAKAIQEALAQGKLKPAPVLVLPKGLASVDDGFALFKEGKASFYREWTPPLLTLHL
jgi:hypothetical protein